MASEKHPFEYPEDLGDNLAGTGASSAAPGAGARKAAAAFGPEIESPDQHPVISGAESNVAPLQGAKPEISDLGPENDSDEQFRRAVEALHEERVRPKKKSA